MSPHVLVCGSCTRPKQAIYQLSYTLAPSLDLAYFFHVSFLLAINLFSLGFSAVAFLIFAMHHSFLFLFHT